MIFLEISEIYRTFDCFNLYFIKCLSLRNLKQKMSDKKESTILVLLLIE
jgi:hypothetical protein